jgi:hypothetical protein
LSRSEAQPQSERRHDGFRKAQPVLTRWSKLRPAKELGRPENSARRLLDLRHSSQMWMVDEALAKMNAELAIDLPKSRAGEGGVGAFVELSATVTVIPAATSKIDVKGVIRDRDQLWAEAYFQETRAENSLFRSGYPGFN